MPPPALRSERERKILLLCPNREVAAQLLPLVSAHAPETAIIPQYSYPPAGTLARLLATPGLQLCFLEVESERETALHLTADIAARQPGLPIVVLLSGNDPDLILRCLRQGASEFLIQPFTADQLTAALEKLHRFQPSGSQVPEKLARLYCVMPGKGACGATSIACNLAYRLKAPGNSKVLLADLDPLTGTVAFLLKLKSSYSVVDALAHVDRLDADLWKVLVNPVSGIDILLSPEDPPNGSSEDWDAAGLLRYCRRLYDVVVVDSGCAYGDWNLALARLADELLLVTTNELPALHATQRTLAFLGGNGLDRSQIRLVVNRYSADRGLATPAIEEALQGRIFHTLPSDYEAIQKAMMDGKPVPIASRFGKSVAALADRLTGRQRPAKSASLLSGLASWFGRR